MGLDNYWSGNIEGKDFNLCGGMCSGNGNESFRGKVYDDFVQYVTGISLYEDEIDNETICGMAEDLENSLNENINAEHFNLTDKEIENLVWMFKEHAKAGHSLTSWY